MAANFYSKTKLFPGWNFPIFFGVFNQFQKLFFLNFISKRRRSKGLNWISYVARTHTHLYNKILHDPISFISVSLSLSHTHTHSLSLSLCVCVISLPSPFSILWESSETNQGLLSPRHYLFFSRNLQPERIRPQKGATTLVITTLAITTLSILCHFAGWCLW